MDEARRVLERLARIEALEGARAPSDELLEELKALVREAEVWLRAEPEPSGAVQALARCRAALSAREVSEVVPLAR